MLKENQVSWSNGCQVLREDLAKNQRQKKKKKETEFLSEGYQVLQCVLGPKTQIHPSLSFQNVQFNDSSASWILPGHLFPGLPPGTAHWDMMVKHGSACGVHSGREKVTLPTAHRLCLEVGQAWSLFCFPPSSLPRHLDPRLAFHRHDKESVPAFTNSLLLGGQLLAERYKHALFSKTFPISGGRQSATAGTTAAFG